MGIVARDSVNRFHRFAIFSKRVKGMGTEKAFGNLRARDIVISAFVTANGVCKNSGNGSQRTASAGLHQSVNQEFNVKQMLAHVYPESTPISNRAPTDE